MAGVVIVSSKTGVAQRTADQMVPGETVSIHVSRCRVKNPLPDRSLDDVAAAYGAWEMPKMVRLLGHDDALTRGPPCRPRRRPARGPPPAAAVRGGG